MFSGIVEKTAKAKKIERDGDSLRVCIRLPRGFRLKLGESVLVDGICSTVEGKTDDGFAVYYMPETLRKTTFTQICDSHLFNLERCLTLGSLIGGHLIDGHVDTTAKFMSIVGEQEAKLLKFEIGEKFTKYIIYKGSIAVNGVSLTVVSVGKDFFSVSLVPYTLTHTNLGELKVGEKVNIEVDLIAKYLEKLIK